MISGLLDSLKVALSDDYNIPDSEYKKLSGIFTNKGLSDVAGSLLVLPQFINCVIKNNVVFPVTYKYLINLWKKDYSDFNFTSTILPLITNKVIKMVKATEKEYSKDTVTKSFDDEKVNDRYLVIYSTDLLNGLVSEVSEVIKPYRVENTSISESALPNGNVSKGVKDLYAKLSKLLKEFSIGVEFESYVLDADINVSTANFILKDTSKYSCSDKDVYKVFKKYLKEKNIKEIEAYIESSKELFVGLSLNSGYKPLEIADEIYLAVKELEVDYV